jgi:phage-related protein
MDYIESNGNNPFADWLAGIPTAVRAHIDVRMLKMETLSKWPEKWASKYKAKEDLWELRIPFQKVEYRPLYVPSPFFRGHLVILAGAIEKGGKIPKNEINNALSRAKQLANGSQHAIRHIF